MLNEHPGLISATKFVGQSQGKQEIDKGFNQKEQKRVGYSGKLFLLTVVGVDHCRV